MYEIEPKYFIRKYSAEPYYDSLLRIMLTQMWLKVKRIKLTCHVNSYLANMNDRKERDPSSIWMYTTYKQL